MRLEELDFDIPEELIAQEPAGAQGLLPPHAPRCRTGAPSSPVFSICPKSFGRAIRLCSTIPGCFPRESRRARATGGKVELLFLRPTG